MGGGWGGIGDVTWAKEIKPESVQTSYGGERRIGQANKGKKDQIEVLGGGGKGENRLS